METFDDFDAAMNTRPDEKAQPAPVPPQTPQNIQQPVFEPKPVGLPVPVAQEHRGGAYHQLEDFLTQHTETLRSIMDIEAQMAACGLSRGIELNRERCELISQLQWIESRLPDLRTRAANEAWSSMREGLNELWGPAAERRVRAARELESVVHELRACISAYMQLHGEQRSILDSYVSMDHLAPGRQSVLEQVMSHQTSVTPVMAWIRGQLEGLLPEGVIDRSENMPLDTTSIEYRGKALP